MGKKKEYPPIQTSAYIRVNGEWTDTRELTPEQKERLGTNIRIWKGRTSGAAPGAIMQDGHPDK